MFDVPREQYAYVIREMLRHENDLTNHRIMWLLIGQGFFANAYASSKSPGFMFPLVGIFVTLSAFLMLYKSYQARAYLRFLGQQAKQGLLPEEHLPLVGWPKNRIKGWWRSVCVCPWFQQVGDLLEPWLFLPSIFLFMWLLILLQQLTRLYPPVEAMLAGILTAVILSAFCIVLVWSQGKEEKLDI
ncbi:MAG TPA: hypothetical protein VIU41_05490 [Geobacteraceae bacterium]